MQLHFPNFGACIIYYNNYEKSKRVLVSVCLSKVENGNGILQKCRLSIVHCINIYSTSISKELCTVLMHGEHVANIVENNRNPENSIVK